MYILTYSGRMGNFKDIHTMILKANREIYNV